MLLSSSDICRLPTKHLSYAGSDLAMQLSNLGRRNNDIRWKRNLNGTARYRLAASRYATQRQKRVRRSAVDSSMRSCPRVWHFTSFSKRVWSNKILLFISIKKEVIKLFVLLYCGASEAFVFGYLFSQWHGEHSPFEKVVALKCFMWSYWCPAFLNKCNFDRKDYRESFSARLSKSQKFVTVGS